MTIEEAKTLLQKAQSRMPLTNEERALLVVAFQILQANVFKLPENVL